MAKTPKILNAHAKKRAKERYGVELNKEARREIVAKIRGNQAEYVGRRSNNRSLWKVSYQDQSLNVVYDKARGTMCTVLPPDAFQSGTPPTSGFERTQKRQQVTDELRALWCVKDEFQSS